MRDRTDTALLIFENAFYSAFSWLFPIFVSLITTRLVVSGLGNDAYGLYAVIVGFISYSFGFGIGRASAKYVSELRAAGETEKMSQAISAVLITSFVLGLLVVILILFTASAIVSDILTIPENSRSVAAPALMVAAVTILVTMISQVFQSILHGLHRFDRYLIVSNVSGLVLSVGNVVLVLNSYGVFALILWNLALVTITGLAFVVTSRRLLPEFKLCFSIPAEIWRTVLVYAGSIVAYQVCGNALLLFERAWIVRQFGTEALTFYVLPMLLCFYFHGLVHNLVIVTFPVVNELLSEKEKLGRMYRSATKAIFALTAFFLVSAIVSGRGFLDVWLGDGFSAQSYTLLAIHAATFSILCISLISWQLAEAFGQAKINAFAGGVWLLTSIPLMVVFSQKWQTEGVAFGRLIGVIGFLGLIIYVENKLLDGRGFRWWLGMAGKVTAAAIVTGSLEFVLMRSVPGTIAAVIAAGSLGGLAFGVTLYLLKFLEQDEHLALAGVTDRFRSYIQKGT